jgi:hypothetical protein
MRNSILATAVLLVGMTLGAASSFASECSDRCHATNPSACEGNSPAIQRCYNKCVGYEYCAQASIPPRSTRRH